MIRSTSWRTLLLVLLALGLGACGGAQMMKAGQPPIIKQDEAMVVFMRSSPLGSAISASLFDVSGPETAFIGILNNGTKVAHPVKPGEHTFMVIGESADFMQATILPGRTYYALVTPRMGVWKARFSFRPVRQIEFDGYEFGRWDAATQFVVNSAETQNWAMQNAADANSKRAQYWSDWIGKPQHQRASQTLNAQDGRALASAAFPAAPVATPATPPTPPTAASSAQPATTSVAAMSTPPANPPAGSVFPRQGDTWTYRFTTPDSASGSKPRHYSVMVAAVTEAAIFERFHIEGGTVGDWAHGRGGYVVPLGPSLFSPYLSVFEQLSPAARLGRIDVTDENCRWPFTCEAEARIVGPETVKVAAGTFEAIKVIVDQTWRSASTYQGLSPSRRLTIWYSPTVKRAVRFSSRPTSHRPPIDANFDLELESYRVQ
ncbi:MAG: hypothetical protein ACRDFW_14020 [bacterium]